MELAFWCMQRLITSILKKNTFGSSQGWFDSKTLSSVKASLCHRRGGEGEKESTRRTTGSAIAAGASAEEKGSMTFQILVRRCGHWSSYQKTSGELYNISKNWRLANDLNRHESLVAEWLARPDGCLEGPWFRCLCPDVRWVTEDKQNNIISERPIVHHILSSDYYLRILKTILTF